MEHRFELNSDYIELNKLLKLLGLVESGGQANLAIENEEVKINENTITFEVTGSPKPFGFKTKGEFIKAMANKGFIHTSLQKGTKYLITDDITSTTSKMNKAKKLGIEIISYDQVLSM